MIRRVWGRAAAAAIDVAACESREEGTDAVHGQYHGLFQLGQWARDRFGGGACAEQQAEAAFRYFVASHRRWTPWKCKPWRRRH